MKVKMNYAKCSIAVLGMDMNCFLCGTLVKSGERHECSKEEPQKKLGSRKPKSLKETK